MTAALETTLRRNEGILHAPVGRDEVVMMSIDAGKYFAVKAVGARIWEMIETPRTIAAICARLCEEFEVDPATCKSEVLQFADELIRNGVARTAAA
jgi:hypothetical protein